MKPTRKIEVLTWIYGAEMYAVSIRIDGRLMQTIVCSAKQVLRTRNRAAEVWAEWADEVFTAPVPRMPSPESPQWSSLAQPSSIVNLMNLKKVCQ